MHVSFPPKHNWSTFMLFRERIIFTYARFHCFMILHINYCQCSLSLSSL